MVSSELNIDANFLKILEKVDKRYSELIDKNNTFSKSAVEAFSRIAKEGIDPFLNKLQQQRDAFQAISSIDMGSKPSAAMKNLAKEASKAVDDINKLLMALQGISTSKDTQRAKKTVASEIDKETNAYFKSLDAQIKARQEYLIRQQNVEKERVRITHDATKQVEKEIQKENDAYLKSLEIKIKAAQEQQLRNEHIRSQRESIASKAKEQVEQEVKAENDAYLKGLNDRIRQEQEYQLRNEKVASERKRVESEVTRHVENEIKKEKDAHLKSLSEQIKARQEYLERVRKLQEAQAKRESEMRLKMFHRIQQYGDTSGQATSAYNRLYGEHGVKSINNMNRTLQKLQDAQNKLNLNTDKGKQKYDELGKKIQQIKKDLNEATQSNEKFHNSHSKLLDTSSQLQRKLALLFSISAIQGYMNKLVEVRKEFELQQKSLEVLLQSKNQADVLWQQTLDLAVKSPFRVKELVTYTRQLAAYRIETDKLHDTTRRLSDVSSGLGVDMQRLILAYGQVRAAQFLRGTELRQFTEAGIPMLDELAKYLTDVEGVSVNVGEVFERISKRMISFEDVTAVFHRMTDAGGAFYKMQEEQSKTLHGMISNLHDSIDLMFNEVGRSYDGVIKGTLNITRSIVDNWQTTADIMKSIAAAFALYKLNMFLASDSVIRLAKNMGVVTTSIPKQLSVLQLLNTGWLKLKKTVISTGKSISTFVSTNPLITFGALAAFTLGKLAFTLIEHEEALDDITDKYDGFRQKLESIKFDFNTAKSNNDVKNLRKNLTDLIAVADRDYGINIKVNMEELEPEQIVSKFNEISQTLFDVNLFTEGFLKAYQRATEWTITDDVFEDLKELGTTAADVFEKAYNKRIQLVNRLRESEESLTSAEKEALGMLSKQKGEFDTEEEFLQNLIDGYNLLANSLGGYYGIFEKFGIAIGNIDRDFTELTKDMDEAKNEFISVLKTINLEGLTDEEKTIRLTTAINTLASQNNWNNFVKNYLYKWTEEEVKVPIGFKVANDGGSLLAWQELYNEKFKGFEGFKEITNSAIKQSDIVERLNENLKVTEELYGRMQKAEKGAYSNYDLETVEKQLNQIKQQRDFLGVDDSDKKNKGKDWFSEIIKSVKDAHSEFVKLNKTLDKTEAKQMALERFKDVFADAAKNAKLSGISLGQFSFETETGVIEALSFLRDRLPKSAKEARFKIEEALSDIRGELRLDNKEINDKAILDNIESLFGSYEISLELEKLNIPSDLAKELFNLDAVTLPELKSKVVDMQHQFVGTDMQEKYAEYLKKIDEMEDKAQLERLKKYTQYLVKGQNERVRIKLEEIRQLSELEELGFSDEQKAEVRRGIQQDTKQKLDKAEWDAFKDSDIYIQMFEDLGVVSSKVLDDLKARLIKMRGSLGDLNPTALKDITQQLEKISKMQSDRNPFEGLAETIAKGIDAIKRLKNEQEKYYNAQKEQDYTEGVINSLKIANAKMEAENEAAKAALLSVDATSAQRSEAQKTIKDNNKSISQNQKLLSLYEEQLQKQKEKTDSSKKNVIQTKAEIVALNNAANSIGQAGSTITNSITNITGMLGNWGVEMSDVTSGIIDGFGQMFGALEQLDLTNPFSFLKTATGLLAGLGNVFASIFGFGNKDKKLEKQIQNNIKYVEQLEKAYEKLEKQIDEAYSIDTLQQTGKMAINNIQSQIESYEKMIAAEDEKKKTDDDRIKEWENEIEALEELKAEKEKELVSTATSGILEDVRSAARDFVDAWLEAFNETGDGLSGLKDNFKETMLEMVKQQAAMLISSAYVDKWKEQLNQYINPNDLELSTDEAKAWVKSVTEMMPQLSEALENYFMAMQQAGVDLGGEGAGELSGLAKGISGITESQADILAAYANSCRFFLANIDTTLTSIANQILGGENTPNPILSELRTQTELVRGISTLLNSVVRGSHSMGGQGIKVFIS